MYRAFTYKVIPHTEKRPRRLMVKDESHGRTYSFPYPEQEPPLSKDEDKAEQRKAAEAHLASRKIKLLKAHTWVGRVVLLSSNMKIDIVPEQADSA